MSEPGGALARILQSTRKDLERRQAKLGIAELEDQLRASSARRSTPFADALARPGIGVIAEHKRRSPSAGVLGQGAGVADLVGAYERGGAIAISVLTEEQHFDGSLDDLRAARAVTSLPVLRKDFIVDRYQLYEAAAAGADAVLLIVAALSPVELAQLGAQATDLGLETLVEVHDAAELDVALSLPAGVIGINNRDLRDFSVDVARTFALLDGVPSNRLVVSESGVDRREQLDQLEAAGVHAVLVGETLMRAPDPEAACRSLSGLRSALGEA